MSLIFLLNHINNSLIMQKIYMTLLVCKHLEELFSIINCTCWISVYCTICYHLIVKQWHFHHSIHHFSKLLTKRNVSSALLNYVKGNTSRFGSAIQVLPPDIGECFSSFSITVVYFCSYFVIEKCIFYHCKFLCQK